MGPRPGPDPAQTRPTKAPCITGPDTKRFAFCVGASRRKPRFSAHSRRPCSAAGGHVNTCFTAVPPAPSHPAYPGGQGRHGLEAKHRGPGIIKSAPDLCTLIAFYEYTFCLNPCRHHPEPCIKIPNHSAHKMLCDRSRDKAYQFPFFSYLHMHSSTTRRLCLDSDNIAPHRAHKYWALNPFYYESHYL